MRTAQFIKVVFICVFVFMVYLLMERVLEDNSGINSKNGANDGGLNGNRKLVNSKAYAVIMDGGSSGSRIHVYVFSKENPGQLELLDETFEMLEPGLSSFADDPKGAADSLKPLFNLALRKVPEYARANTPIALRATAGLRLIGEEKAGRILDEVDKLMRASGFNYKRDNLSIMGGADEGLYAWVTVNFLKKKLGNPAMETSGVLDLGGGSTQIAFAVNRNEAEQISKDDVHSLKFNGVNYNVYVHSYLGLGLNEARKTIMGVNDNEAKHCVPSNTKSLEFGEAKVSTGEGDMGMCYKRIDSVLFQVDDKQNKCIALDLEDTMTCKIGGVMQPKVDSREFHAFSFYYDRAIDMGLMSGENHVLTPEAFKNSAEKVCVLDKDSIWQQYPTISKRKDVLFQCMDNTYIYNLLNKLGFKDDQKLSLTKKIDGAETGWCLGAAIDELEKM